MAAKSRVRRGGVLLVLAGALLLVFGRGLGLWSGGDGGDVGTAGARGAGDAAPGAPPTEDPALAGGSRRPNPRDPGPGDPGRGDPDGNPANGAAATPDAAATAAPGADRHAGGGTTAGEPADTERAAEPTGATVPAPASDGAPAAEPAPTAAPFDDRRDARLAMIRGALEDGRIGRALEVLGRMPAGDAAAVDVAELRTSAQRQLAAGCDAVLRDLKAGAVLDARGRLERLLVERHPTVVAAVAALCDAQGWPSLLATGNSAGRPPAPRSAPVDLADRVVRIRSEGDALVRVRVVAQSAAGVTVRVVGPEGVTFPLLPAWSVEPEAVRPEEAAELGLGALATGDQFAARLWCACALARAAGEPPVRARELQALLQ